MPYPATVTRQDMCFEIPSEEFLNLLHFEGADWRQFELPTLSTILDRIDGVANADYNGHFGSYVYAQFELDENNEVPQLVEFQERLEEFFTDVRRTADLMPALLAAGKSGVGEYAQFDEKGNTVKRKLLYSDEQFMISDSMHEHSIAVFYKEGGLPKMKEIHRVSGILDLIHADRQERSFDRHSRKEITLSRDIPKVRMRVAKHLNLPDLPKMVPAPTPVDISSHFLKGELPSGAVPIYSQPLFIIADSGKDMGVSITFKSDGEVGTKWYTDGAREQIIQNVGEVDRSAVERWVLRQLPVDLDGPEVFSSHMKR